MRNTALLAKSGFLPNGKMRLNYENCGLCPRECGADRRSALGYCGCGGTAVVSKVMLHCWEEPPISGDRGSGAVFFSGCNLRCNYCQNRDISFAVRGAPRTAEQLSGDFLRLVGDGAHNINLVTATPYLPTVITALRIAKLGGLTVPVVYNTGGYEKVEAVEALGSHVDVWLPDFKYMSAELSAKYSAAPDYPDVAVNAIDAMVRQAGAPVIENGLIKRGVIIRHLVLPGHRDDSVRVVREIARRWGGRVLVSLMRQFTPEFASPDCDLKRRVTSFEYNAVLDAAAECGLNGFCQDADSATAAFTPDFVTEKS